jgi:hypothetical protein
VIGIPIVERLGCFSARITGVAVEKAGAVTLGLAPDAGVDIHLPADFHTLDDVEVEIVQTTAGEGAPVWHITTTVVPQFRVTLHNDDPDNATPELEIYCTSIHSLFQ